MEIGVGASRYWCHMCSQTVNDPITDIESMKCPNCESGFVEEMASANLDFGSDNERALSLWAPILLGIMANPIHRLRPLRQLESEDHDHDHDHNDDDDDDEESRRRRTRRMRRRTRRRSSAAILQLLQGIRAGMMMESETGDGDSRSIVVQGQQHRAPPVASLSDYFTGPGLDLLLQHLAENDPSRSSSSGTPPAQREAVEALATVEIEEAVQCAVCLDDCDLRSQLKEMPCKHKFHSTCIVPWLHLHSSCPVCRYKLVSTTTTTTTTTTANNSNGARSSLPLPLLWPFSTFFPSSTSQPTSSTGWSLTSPSTDAHAPPTTDQN